MPPTVEKERLTNVNKTNSLQTSAERTDLQTSRGYTGLLEFT